MLAPSTENAATLLARARALRPDILAHRAEIETGRKVPASLAKRLREAQMFELWLPSAFGGPELPPADFVAVIEELSRADGSVGWCATVSSVCSLLAGSLPEAGAREIFSDHNIVAGTVNPTGKAVAVEGGYRVTGRWAYGSGIDNSAWVVGNCIVHDGAEPRRRASGAPEMRFVLFPRDEVEIIDTWRVSGLRGTGSHDFCIQDVFAPEAHSAPAFVSTGAQPGPLYRDAACQPVRDFARGGRARDRARGDRGVARTCAGEDAGRFALHASRQAGRAKRDRARRGARARLPRLSLSAIGDQWDEVASGAAPSMAKRAAIRMACTFAGSLRRGGGHRPQSGGRQRDPGKRQDRALLPRHSRRHATHRPCHQQLRTLRPRAARASTRERCGFSAPASCDRS